MNDDQLAKFFDSLNGAVESISSVLDPIIENPEIFIIETIESTSEAIVEAIVEVAG
jgi:hypothetical protein